MDTNYCIQAQMEEELIKLRKEKKITQTEIAKHLGIGKSALSKKENGSLNFTVEQLEMYAEYLSRELGVLKPKKTKN